MTSTVVTHPKNTKPIDANSIAITKFVSKSIIVCPLARVEHVLTSTSPSSPKHIISLLSGDMSLPTPSGIIKENHLSIAMNDITQPQEGYVLPEQHHILQLIEFISRWDQTSPLLIHCWAGVSRSTAAAYIALCALEPDACEYALAYELRKQSPTATPNARLIQLADTALSREGRMVRAIERIGRGADCSEGSPFALQVNQKRALRAA